MNYHTRDLYFDHANASTERVSEVAEGTQDHEQGGEEMNAFPVINLKKTGKRINMIRTKSGMSVRQMQEYFGFATPQAIYKWMNGTTLPTVDNLIALTQLLQVPVEDIIVVDTWTGQGTPA